MANLMKAGALVCLLLAETAVGFLTPPSMVASLPGGGKKLHNRVSPPRSRNSGDSWAAGVQEAVSKAVVDSPAYGMLKEKARDMMIKTAEKNGINWKGIVKQLETARPWETLKEAIVQSNPGLVVPEYFRAPFHAYDDGNLCWSAAFEQEVASASVALRTFPKDGASAEKKLRERYLHMVQEMGALVEEGGNILDFGGGTGVSGRFLADHYPQAGRVLAMDLSPEMLAVGQHLLAERPVERLKLMYGDVANSALPSASVSLVSLSFILHEMPAEVVQQVLAEAHRVLKPGGSLAIMDMDPETPGYSKLRRNPFLYSIVRSTEPYLSEWFKLAPAIQDALEAVGFATVRKNAVSGRHMAVVATKQGSLDLRPSWMERAIMDEHLKTWE